ncbi:MAG TPA: UDP-N-acetylglucosamine--N-acetylmuramyl-(pentapeptide) pyrophosphoryl-undecaprenol N-acetylglucosamine transferase [Vicinamibacterales bacterium]|nr:UDP-N-acetylglucosamine--N-acetylmuramyl-(pentapeptide) pyrophosphoryl-undecaprenol N-acetylglucosamine transferase [Vicinamibacterales bacterium]HOG28281.1 UDP-N-acetylglucosamine--N-acetylmuramyl-(pentapeptide) pyrophosphoryl-undecaprenol N-acetylglucosamine transferase [Vicinamibacterales bacterium]HPW19885.1 UDP-N-acetylglucosamine--N-acetylmuramyl-(pentapeptide) pyrophosphoryl-undecaprenol N-acetylglucosamine transferase [Vicinamibacterales bacterium]
MTAFSRILLTGGGTAGHVNPALAIGRALGDERTAYLYVGVRGRAEADVVPREGVPIRFVRASPYPGARPSLAWPGFLFDLLVGTAQALAIVRSFRPDVIIGTGGFASAPTMVAAAILRRLGLTEARLYVHEQNAAPGRLNLLVGRLADRVFVAFDDTLAAFPSNGVLAGYPLRRRIRRLDPEAARAALDFAVEPGRRVVFAFGGSQGARTINRAVVDALGSLLPHKDRLLVVHGTGLRRGAGALDPDADARARLAERYTEEERRAIAGFYVARPYFHQIEHVYALADLVVVRGGAGTLNEVAALGLPAIVVPKTNLPGEHQVMNARALAASGGAVVLYEERRLEGGEAVEALDGAVLASQILSLLDTPGRLEQMGASTRAFVRRDALDAIRRSICGEAAAPPDAAAPPAGGRLLSSEALLYALEHRRASTVPAGARRPEQPAPADRAYYVARAASLAASPAWETRNLGVKLIGLLEARDKLPVLLAILGDRTPAPWYKRALGGDYAQVGFIRRNALTAIARLGVVTPDVETRLSASLDDPYYEARAEAARTITALDRGLSEAGRARLIAGLIGRLGDRWLEVAAAAAEALGRVGGEADALPALLALADHRFWAVRAAGLRGLHALVERGRGGDLDALERRVRAFPLTATDFRPEFSIRTAYARLIRAIGAKRSAT